MRGRNFFQSSIFSSQALRKRGLSLVIATILLIVLVFILFFLIFPWLKGLISEQIEKDGQEIENVCPSVNFKVNLVNKNSSHYLEIVNRGNVDIHSLEIKMIDENGDSKLYDLGGANLSINPGETKKQEVVLNIEGKIVEKIIVYPILLGIVRGGTLEKTYTCVDIGKTLIVERCIPKNCSSLGYECGYPWGDGCGGILDCGDCEEGKECNASGVCVKTPDGTPEDPYPISNCQDLQEMEKNLSAYYILINDINCSETRNWNWNETEGIYNGFRPVGSAKLYSNPFTGSFDGNGNIISDLYINRPSESYISLFGCVDSGIEVKNVGIINVNITGNNNVGGLVGENINSSITNSYSTGSVNGGDNIGGLVGWNCYGATITNSYSTGSVNGNERIGGLVGQNYYEVTITNSYSTGNVTGTMFRVGGLVGSNNVGIITNSYSTGSVNGNERIGGLVGYNYYEGIISNSYSTGSVTGEYDVGGLVGYNNGEVITKSYSTGSVTGTSIVGGLVGRECGNNYKGTIINSYSIGNVSATGVGGIDGGLVGSSCGGLILASFWDTQTSGQSTSNGGGTGKTTAQMMDYDTFNDVDWEIVLIGDYVETWFIDDGIDYPRLGL